MKKYALITGGARGIGFELAKQFADDGYDLILVSRNTANLESAAQELTSKYTSDVRCISADLSDENVIARFGNEIDKLGIIPDVLVNNSGFGLQGEFAELDLMRQLNMIDLNIRAVVGLSRILLPHMIKRGSGAILNVASIAAFFPGPYMTIYYASKTFVLYFTEALYQELKGSGVRVSVVCPGPTATDFGADSGLDKIKLIKRKYFPLMSSARVAAAGYKEFKSGKRVIVPGMLNKVSSMFAPLIPRSVTSGILKSLNTQV